MMSPVVAGIDPRQSSFTVAAVDANGVEITHASFANGRVGYLEATELLSSHGVCQVGGGRLSQLGITRRDRSRRGRLRCSRGAAPTAVHVNGASGRGGARFPDAIIGWVARSNLGCKPALPTPLTASVGSLPGLARR